MYLWYPDKNTCTSELGKVKLLVKQKYNNNCIMQL